VIDGRRFTPILIGVAAVILIHQVADLATLLPGTDFATPAGRVRQLLAVEARSPGVLTADLLLIWALLRGGYRRGLRLTRTLHFGLGVLLLALVPWFLLDAGQVAGAFAGTESRAFRIVVSRTLLMLSLLGVGALLAGRALHGYLAEAKTPEQ